MWFLQYRGKANGPRGCIVPQLNGMLRSGLGKYSGLVMSVVVFDSGMPD